MCEGHAFDLRLRDHHSEIGDLSLPGNVEAGSGHPGPARNGHTTGKPLNGRAACPCRTPCAGPIRDWPGPRRVGYAGGVFENSGYLAAVCRAQNNYPMAYRYLAAAGATRDSLFGPVKVAQLQALAFGEQHRGNLPQEHPHQNQLQFGGGVGSVRY